jgi:N-acetylmuramoyl-L-alanine amidase
MNLIGKVSWFGGPEDTGVAPDEGLAFIYEVDDAPHLFLPQQPSGTTGLARRLDPDTHYVACRWDYSVYPKPMLLQHKALVRSVKTGKAYEAYPADWGPHVDTDRVADISPGLMEDLGLKTDDEVEVIFPFSRSMPVTYNRIVISSGHGKWVRGASGVLDEVDEARRVVEQLADELRNRNVDVMVFHDDTSHSQNENLNTIVNYHNKQERDLDVSVHFNAYEQTSKPMGCEVLYVTQSALATEVSRAIADCGFINRGGKKRSDLFFLNNTEKPAILIETCFVDSTTDADIYETEFYKICKRIADVLGGKEAGVPPEEIEGPQPIPPPVPSSRIDIQVSGDATVTINGVVVWPE